MALHRLEIAVRMQERVAVFDAKRADYEVGRLADGDSEPAKGSVIPGGRYREVRVEHCDRWENSERLFDSLRVALVARSLQDFDQHNIAHE